MGSSCPALPKSDTVLGAKKWRMVKKLCLGIEIAESEDEEFCIVDTM